MSTLKLDNFTEDELIVLLRAQNLKACYPHLSENKQHLLQQFEPTGHHKKRLASKLFQAFAVPLSDTNNFPLILFWSAMGVITLQAVMLLTGSILMALLSLVMGALLVYSNYQEIKKAEKKFSKFYKLSTVQTLAAEMLLARRGLKIEARNHPEFHNKYRLSLLKNALRAAMLIATPLFGTYILGLHIVLIVFKASVVAGFLSGGPGFAIGLILAILIGTVCAYQAYHAGLDEKKQAFEKKYLMAELGHKKNIAVGLTTSEISYDEQNGELRSQKPLPMPEKSRAMDFKYSKTPVVFFKPDKSPEDTGPVYRIQVH